LYPGKYPKGTGIYVIPSCRTDRVIDATVHCELICGVLMDGRCLDSQWFVWVSQSNHIPMDIEEDQDRPWLALQV